MTEILAFTADHVCRLTSLSQRQLRYWDATDFFSPAIVDGFGRRTFGRIYSFRDLVGLRTIAVLRQEHKVPLQELRRAAQWLQENEPDFAAPWATLRFGLHGRKVVFIHPLTGVPTEASGGGQTVFSVALKPIANEMRRAADALRKRRSEQVGQIERNRFVVHTRDVVAGTRIPTLAIWNFHQAGYRAKAIIEQYPSLKPADVRAAIQFEKKRLAA
jgi:DNA-binding transcriptional MerR regulator